MAAVVDHVASSLPFPHAVLRQGVRRHVTGVAMFVALAAAALAIDVPLATLCHDGVLPGDLVRLLQWAELFAHGSGVPLILMAAWVLDPANRRRLARVAAAAYGAGLLSNGLKLAIARFRPTIFGDQGAALDSFGPWLPFLPGQVAEGWGHASQSFPSGHAATAVALAVTLSAIYPRGRWLFPFFAFLACFQRMSAGAHYLSDVLIGAALGLVMTALLSEGTPGGDWLSRWELA